MAQNNLGPGSLPVSCLFLSQSLLVCAFPVITFVPGYCRAFLRFLCYNVAPSTSKQGKGWLPQLGPTVHRWWAGSGEALCSARLG